MESTQYCPSTDDVQGAGAFKGPSLLRVQSYKCIVINTIRVDAYGNSRPPSIRHPIGRQDRLK